MCLADFVAQDVDRLRLPPNIDSDAAFLGEPLDPVLLDAVPIPLERCRALLPEQDAYFAACPDIVVADDIVSIVVPNGDAVSLAAYLWIVSTRPA